MTRNTWLNNVLSLFRNPEYLDLRTIKYNERIGCYTARHKKMGFLCYSELVKAKQAK